MKSIIQITFIVALLFSSCTPYQQTNSLSGNIPATSLVSKISTSTCTPTFTLAPQASMIQTRMATSTPSVIPTLACNYSLEFYAIAYLNSRVQISFNTPYDLTRFLNGNILELPGLVVYKNGLKIQDYKAYLAGNKKQRLYLLGTWSPGDTISLEILEDNSRNCSKPYTIPAPISMPIPTLPTSHDQSVCVPDGQCYCIPNPPPTDCPPNSTPHGGITCYDSCGNVAPFCPQGSDGCSGDGGG